MKNTLPTHKIARAGFTLVELLTVVTIILVLVGMVSGISGFVTEKQARAQANTVIKALGGSIDKYELDNGVYPASGSDDAASRLDPRATANPSSYVSAIRELGDELYNEDPNLNYLKGFKPSTVVISSDTVRQILDPWGNSYGYSTARNRELREGLTPSMGYNPTYDLWSTANKSAVGASDAWISNW
jgi:prepilin-type N-terminal cleavage/methylation domain-containing protein